MRATRPSVAPAPTTIPSSWPGVAISIEGLIGTNSKLVCQVYLEGSWGKGMRLCLCVHVEWYEVRGGRRMVMVVVVELRLGFGGMS